MYVELLFLNMIELFLLLIVGISLFSGVLTFNNQGIHRHWKTWNMAQKNSIPGKIIQFEKSGNIMEFEKRGTYQG